MSARETFNEAMTPILANDGSAAYVPRFNPERIFIKGSFTLDQLEKITKAAQAYFAESSECPF